MENVDGFNDFSDIEKNTFSCLELMKEGGIPEWVPETEKTQYQGFKNVKSEQDRKRVIRNVFHHFENKKRQLILSQNSEFKFDSTNPIESANRIYNILYNDDNQAKEDLQQGRFLDILSKLKNALSFIKFDDREPKNTKRKMN